MSDRFTRGTPFPRRVLIAVGITVLILALSLFLWNVVEVLLLVFASVLFAVFLNGLRCLLSNRLPISEHWSLAIVVLALLIITTLTVVTVAPGISQQFGELVEVFPQSIAALQTWTTDYEWMQALWNEAPPPAELLPTTTDMLSQATGIFSTALSAIAGFFLVLIVGLYLAVSPGMYLDGTLKLIPVAWRQRGKTVLTTTGTTLWWWLIGRLLSMVAVGVLTTVGLWLLGVPLAVPLGIIAGILDFIPNVGPILATVPGLLVALLQGPQQALFVLILYIVIQQIESYLLTPIVQQHTVKLPPALSILSVILLGVLFGVLGLILAAPLAAVALVLVKMLYIEDVLGDHEYAQNSEEEKAEAQA